MAQITFSDDVGRVSAATNLDASIRWYCYERPAGTGTSIFVQRESNGILEAEVQFLAEGDRPEIFFDPVTSQWIFTYRLNENLWMITIDEPDVPVLQIAQTGTIINHHRPGMSDHATRTVKQTINERVISLSHTDVDNTPSAVVAVGVGGRDSTYIVQWRAEPSITTDLNLNIAGFNIHVKRHGDGAVVQVNTELIPFKGFDPYEYSVEVPIVPGTYYVTQVSYRGDASSNLIQSRIKAPLNEIFDYSFFSAPLKLTSGEARSPEDLNFIIVETRPVVIKREDVFDIGYNGDGLIASSSMPYRYDIIQVVSSSGVQPLDDIYSLEHNGDGIAVRISGSGFGTIIVG